MNNLLIILALTAGNWISILVPAGILLLGGIATIIYRQGKVDGEVNGIRDLIVSVDKKVEKIGDKFDGFLMSSLAVSHSPMRLTDKGDEIFKKEPIQKFIADKFEEIVEKLRAANKESAYRAQEELFDIVNLYKHDPEYKVIFENESFNSGQHIDILLKVIAIGIRDRVFEQLEINVDHIDKTDPAKQENNSDEETIKE